MDAKPIPLNEEILECDITLPVRTEPLDRSAANARRRGEERRASERQSASPPVVTRGALLQAPPPSCPAKGVYTSVDYFRAVGPESLVPALVEWCSDRFGTGRPMRPRMFGFSGGFEFESGATIQTGHNSGICLIEFSGAALAVLSADQRLNLMRDVLFHFRMITRRLDIARDYVGQDLKLFKNAWDSCEREELCGARVDSWSLWLNGGTSRTLYLGKRGKAGSGRMVRIYDKGREQKVPGILAGYWERYEAEFCKDVSHAAALMILGEREEFEEWASAKRKAAEPSPYAPPSRRKPVLQWRDDLGATWVERAAALTFGAFDFREVGGASRELSRRERVTWYAQMVKGVKTLKLSAVRRFPTLSRWAKWMGTAALPTVLAMAKGRSEHEGKSVSLDDMFRGVIAKAVEAAKPGKRSVLWEFLASMKDDAAYWRVPDSWTPPRLKRVLT